MKKINIIFLIILCSCSSNNNDSSQSSEVTLENSTIENNVIKKDSNLDNEDSGTAGSFNLPAYNGSCIYSEEEAVNELKAYKMKTVLLLKLTYFIRLDHQNVLVGSGVLVCHRVYWSMKVYLKLI